MLSEHWEMSVGKLTDGYNSKQNISSSSVPLSWQSLCLFFSQYIFMCLRNGLNPHLTMVHRSTISKYQEEQGRMCSQVYKSRSLSRPPPLPLKKVKVSQRLSSFINRAASFFLSPPSLSLLITVVPQPDCATQC